MGSSSSNKVYDSIRREWVVATPEESLRQRLLQQLVQMLGYPAGLISLEKELRKLPHLMGVDSIPSRRADLIVFGRNVHPQHALYPLLLIECKAVKLTDAVLNQVLGYNYFVQAPVVAIANADAVQVAFWTGSAYHFSNRLPTYAELLDIKFECRPLPESRR